MKKFMFCVHTHPAKSLTSRFAVRSGATHALQFPRSPFRTRIRFPRSATNKHKDHPNNWVVFVFVGGAGGNRTRVRTPSTGRSTYLESII